jgi:hypothetical protein
VKPIYSDEDRSKAVRNFIVARYEGLAKIASFGSIVPYLNEKRVKLLCKLEQSGENLGNKFYIEDDAETYFEWLTSVVTGAESASEDIIKQANDQLFIFILALRNDTGIDEHVKLVEPYNWERQLTYIANSIADSQKATEKRDEQITTILERIFQWMKEYRPTLDEVKKDYNDKLGKALKK